MPIHFTTLTILLDNKFQIQLYYEIFPDLQNFLN